MNSLSQVRWPEYIDPRQLIRMWPDNEEDNKYAEYGDLLYDSVCCI